MTLANTLILLMSSGHVKLNFHILNTFTKKGTCQNMLSFWRDVALASKNVNVKNLESYYEDYTKHCQYPRSYHLSHCLSKYDLVAPKTVPWKPQKRTKKPLLLSTTPTPQT